MVPSFLRIASLLRSCGRLRGSIHTWAFKSTLLSESISRPPLLPRCEWGESRDNSQQPSPAAPVQWAVLKPVAAVLVVQVFCKQSLTFSHIRAASWFESVQHKIIVYTQSMFQKKSNFRNSKLILGPWANRNLCLAQICLLPFKLDTPSPIVITMGKSGKNEVWL